MYLPSCKILWKSMHIFIGKFGLKNKKSPKKCVFLCFFTCKQCLMVVKPQFFLFLVNIACLGLPKKFLTSYLKKWLSYDCLKTHGRKENTRKWPFLGIFGQNSLLIKVLTSKNFVKEYFLMWETKKKRIMKVADF